MKPKVYVSDINRFIYCPRVIYLSRVLGYEDKPSPDRYGKLILDALWRDLSMRLPDILSKASDTLDVRELILDEIKDIAGCFPRKHHDLFDKSPDKTGAFLLLRGAETDIIDDLDSLVSKLVYMIESAGLEKTLSEVTPLRVDYYVGSDELGLSGRIDKVYSDRGVLYPSVIKSGAIPSRIWWGARVQAQAYAMLLEHESDIDLSFSFIEYVRAFDRRPVKHTKQLRGAVLEARDGIVDVLGGFVPSLCPHGNRVKCGGCSFRRECYII
ncbi:MAG: hypothetical protein B6U97_00610 [Candidatus Altiarchaeales archaeon ex4484_96]|nr:MAG: hypothetical protein B6U97_00610 [Candidatus Altiarchaeales archaeon ex4484_96]